MFSKIGSPLSRSSNSPWLESLPSRSDRSRFENPCASSVSTWSAPVGSELSSDIRRTHTPLLRVESKTQNQEYCGVDGPYLVIYYQTFLTGVQLMQTKQRKTRLLNSSLRFRARNERVDDCRPLSANTQNLRPAEDRPTHQNHLTRPFQVDCTRTVFDDRCTPLALSRVVVERYSSPVFDCANIQRSGVTHIPRLERD